MVFQEIAISKFACIVFALLLHFNLAARSLVLKEIRLNHKPYTLKSSDTVITMVSGHNDVYLEFEEIAGSNYAYHLAGFEIDTTHTAYPTARYMQLARGTYVFEMQARSNEKTTHKYRLTFHVEPSIAEVWWFYPVLATCGLLLLGGGIYLFFLYNFRQKMRVYHLRNKIASDLHDEIGSTLSSIAISSRVINDKIREAPPQVKEILEQIKTDSEDTLMSIRDTVWALNPDNDSFETLLRKTESFARQILTARDIRLKFESKVKGEVQLSIESRKNLFLIFKETINNIAKHANATEASIRIVQHSDTLKINIADNGRGFDTTESHEGNGLKNLKKRAGESQIDLEITSIHGKGTSVSMAMLMV